MKIEFDVPEWVIGRQIYIFAGNELLADKRVQVHHENGKHIVSYLPLRLKPEKGRCTGCGSCCATTSFSRKTFIAMKKALHGFKDYEKRCPFITDDGCMLGPKIPYSCVRSLCTDYDGCTERLEVVE